MTDDAANTTMTSLSRPSSPRRKGSVKGGLAYLASRRGSRDSVASNMSNVSNEDIGPLNFQNTARGRQRRTSNFLELPGEFQWNA
jgi:Rad/Gem-related GTP binding protein 1